MKFVKIETELCSGSRIVHYKCEDFEVSATKHCVVLQGSIELAKDDDLDVLALYISKAWQQHRRMKNEKME